MVEASLPPPNSSLPYFIVIAVKLIIFCIIFTMIYQSIAQINLYKLILLPRIPYSNVVYCTIVHQPKSHPAICNNSNIHFLLYYILDTQTNNDARSLVISCSHRLGIHLFQLHSCELSNYRISFFAQIFHQTVTVSCSPRRKFL